MIFQKQVAFLPCASVTGKRVLGSLRSLCRQELGQELGMDLRIMFVIWQCCADHRAIELSGRLVDPVPHPYYGTTSKAVFITPAD
jgi:hypothetical protein